MTQDTPIYDVAIIGAGPAGLAAAQQLVKHGARVAILDEQLRPGGQIMRQPPKSFRARRWLEGALYTGMKALLAAMEDHTDIAWHLGVTVKGIARQVDDVFQVKIGNADGLDVLRARRVLIATGCYERPLAFPGCTVPGVMGAGAIQTFLKSQQVLVGARFVFSGVHPLQLIVADQVVAAGGEVAAVAFAQPFTRAFAALRAPLLPLQHWRTFLAAMGAFWRLKKAGVPILFKHAVTQVEGGNGVERVTLETLTSQGARTNKPPRVYDVDTVGLCYGFQISSELPRQIGAATRWSDLRGGWRVTVDAWWQSSVSGVFAAGETTGIAGAEAGMTEGHIVGVGLCLGLGLIDQSRADAAAKPHRERIKSQMKFARFLAKFSQMPPQLSAALRTPGSLLCRCENVTCGALTDTLEAHPHLARANSIKLLSRVGMGLCQGRLCYANMADMVDAQKSIAPEALGPFHAQWPVKPVPISSLLDDDGA